MTDNIEFYRRIASNREKIGQATMKSYTSMLRNMYYKAHDTTKKDPIDFNWYLDQDKVLSTIADKDPKVRKTYLSALLALVGKDAGEKYSEQMQGDVKKYNEWVNKQEMTPKQKENWISLDRVNEKVEEHERRVKKILKKPQLTEEEVHYMKDWLILALTTGYYFPPRRSLDWVEMKFKPKDQKEGENYMNLRKSKFVFHKYKSSATYGMQEISIPEKLKKLLAEYVKKIPDGVDRLLTDYHWGIMNSPKITYQLNTIFRSHVSTSMLRHIYLSSTLKDIPPLEKLNEIAHDMGHCVGQQLQYIKR